MDQDRLNLLTDLLTTVVKCQHNLEWTPLKDTLKDRLTAHPKDYHLLRYLVSVVEDEDLTKDVRYSIASWMYVTNRINYPFSDIFVVDDIVYICTIRPGLWIGKGGETVDSLTNSLNRKVDGTKYRDLQVRLIEGNNDVYGYIQTLDRFCDSCMNS